MFTNPTKEVSGMAMVIKNNISGTNVLNRLNKNTKSLAKNLKQLSSGQKINGAGDDTSGYSISERMRVQIRSLEADVQNVQNGSSMLGVASGAIDSIVEELRNLKELALNSANDHNTDLDRQTLQKEYEQRKANINDIASSTNYNGKLLINGNFENFLLKMQRTRENAASDVENEWWRNELRDADSRALNPNAASVSPPTNVRQLPPASGITTTITTNGVYDITGLTGQLSISSSATNVMLTGTSGADLFVVANNNTLLDLWLDNVTINTSAYQRPSINMSNGGDNKTLHLLGTNNITNSDADSMAIIQFGYGANNSLTICGEGGTLNVSDSNSSGRTGAIIGVPRGQSGGNLIIDQGVTINAQGKTNGAGIGSSAAWSGSTGAMGDIVIGYDAKINVSVEGNGAAIGVGANGGIGGDITIYPGAEVHAYSTQGAGIGSGIGGQCGSITICSDTIVDASTVGVSSGIGIGAPSASPSFNSNCGPVTIYSGADVQSSSGQTAIGSPSTIYGGSQIVTSPPQNNILSEELYFWGNRKISVPTSPEDLNQLGISSGSDNALVLQSGTKAGQAMNCYLAKMSSDRLGLDNTALVPQEEAIRALAYIDAGLEYALDEATNVGAYMSRLEYTKDNLTISNENVQSSESVIRDADMASTMTEFTKNNILTQAAQSMLAQANQSASNVLSLLQ